MRDDLGLPQMTPLVSADGPTDSVALPDGSRPMPRQEGALGEGRVERPDLERFTRRIARCSKRFDARFSPIEMESVIAYAARLEHQRDQATAALERQARVVKAATVWTEFSTRKRQMNDEDMPQGDEVAWFVADLWSAVAALAAPPATEGD